jgi:hypothetical protein
MSGKTVRSSFVRCHFEWNLGGLDIEADNPQQGYELDVEFKGCHFKHNVIFGLSIGIGLQPTGRMTKLDVVECEFEEHGDWHLEVGYTSIVFVRRILFSKCKFFNSDSFTASIHGGKGRFDSGCTFERNGKGRKVVCTDLSFNGWDRSWAGNPDNPTDPKGKAKLLLEPDPLEVAPPAPSLMQMDWEVDGCKFDLSRGWSGGMEQPTKNPDDPIGAIAVGMWQVWPSRGLDSRVETPTRYGRGNVSVSVTNCEVTSSAATHPAVFIRQRAIDDGTGIGKVSVTFSGNKNLTTNQDLQWVLSPVPDEFKKAKPALPPGPNSLPF